MRKGRTGFGWASIDMFSVRTHPNRRKKVSDKAYKKRRVRSAEQVIHSLGSRVDHELIEHLVKVEGLTLSQARKIARRDN